MPVEAGHMPQLYLGHLNLPPQFCTYEVCPPWFWRDSDAPEPRFVENLTQMGKSQTSPSTRSIMLSDTLIMGSLM